MADEVTDKTGAWKDVPVETRTMPVGVWTETVEEILRPLAERQVCPDHPTEQPHGGHAWTAMPDPRFKALRAPISDAEAIMSGGKPRSYRIDASLGAIVRAAAACGLEAMEQVFTACMDALNRGEAPEMAAARALVAAVAMG